MTKRTIKSFVFLLSVMVMAFFASCENAVTPPEEPQKYTVTFDANDGSENPAKETQTFTEQTAQELKAFVELGFKREGYKFLGWAEDKNAAEAEFTDKQKYTATKNITFYAVWKYLPKKFIVTFDANDGTDNPAILTQDFTEGKAQALKAFDELGFEKEGYEFLGWSNNKNATAAAFKDKQEYTASENVTLYAIWEYIPKTFTVTFIADHDGKEVRDIKHVKENTFIKTPDETKLDLNRSGYDFSGWSKEENAEACEIGSGSYTDAITGNITFYAVWSKKHIKITYIENNGTAYSTTREDYTKAHTDFTLKTVEYLVFMKNYHDFAGWALKSDASENDIVYTDGATCQFTDDVTLYAVWKIRKCTVKFYMNDGTDEFTSIELNEGNEISLPSRVREYYTFKGWAHNTSSSASYEAGKSIRITENETFYAVWEPIEFWITYDANGGQFSSNESRKSVLYYMGQPGEILSPSKSDLRRSAHTFVGWSTNRDAQLIDFTKPNGTSEFSSGSSFTPTGDKRSMTLYAIWSENFYTVTFDANFDGANYETVTQKFAEGEEQNLTACSFERPYYRFLGWASYKDATIAPYKDQESYFTYRDVTLYAVWERLIYRISFDANNGSGKWHDQHVNGGQEIELPDASDLDFSKEHYSFVGWSTTKVTDFEDPDVENCLHAGDKYTVTDSKNLYAVWKRITYLIKFDANNGSTPSSSITQIFKAGEEKELPTVSDFNFSKEHYHFVGWSTNKNALLEAFETPNKTSEFLPGNNFTATEATTFYAIWRERALTSITVTSPSKDLYWANEAFDGSGITVTANYNDNSSESVSDFTTSGFNSTVAGIKPLTISYTKNGITKSTTVNYYVAAADALTEAPIAGESETVTYHGAVPSRTFDTVLFGDFPQSKAAAGITFSTGIVYNNWYIGSDGYFYEMVDSDYYKVEPIEWRVLTNDYDHDQDPATPGQRLLFAQKYLTANIPYLLCRYSLGQYERTISGNTVYTNNYKYSQARAWLNGLSYYNAENEVIETYVNENFLSKSFTETAKDLISVTTVDNSGDEGNPYICENTSDKIFLLSKNEVMNSDLSFENYEMATFCRQKETTGYASAMLKKMDFVYYGNGKKPDECNGWLLRTPSNSNDRGMFSYSVYKTGTIENDTDAITLDRGICPAICIPVED